jgi:hypothetical protein
MTAWIDRYRLMHEEQYRRLDALLADSDDVSGAVDKEETR